MPLVDGGVVQAGAVPLTLSSVTEPARFRSPSRAGSDELLRCDRASESAFYVRHRAPGASGVQALRHEGRARCALTFAGGESGLRLIVNVDMGPTESAVYVTLKTVRAGVAKP